MTEILDVAVVGAGPYGLSLAAHLRSRNVDFRVFGDPMGPWEHNMPKGMLLKSYPWACNLSDAEDSFTLKRFCADRGVAYSDRMTPLPRENFISYGRAFQARFTPFVENKQLIQLEPITSGLRAVFDDGEIVMARRVVIAVGLSPFRYMPAIADRLPSELRSHSADYGTAEALRGRSVAIIGSGASATDLAALLHESGIEVTLVARAADLRFAAPPRRRGLLERGLAPTSGIGNGWGLRVCAGAPGAVHMLPAEMRARLASAKALGPLAGSFMRDRLVGKVPLLLGRAVRDIDVHQGGLDLRLEARDGRSEVLPVDHVIFATGYKVDVAKLPFLAPKTAAQLRRVDGFPRLSRHFESVIPGLHFVGPAAAGSFGPVCRYIFGGRDAAKRLARHLPASVTRRAVTVVKAVPVTSAALP